MTARKDTAADTVDQGVPADAGVIDDDDFVEVYVGQDQTAQEAAQKLLKAAADLKLDEERTVLTLGGGGFRVPSKVAKKAGYGDGSRS